MKTNFMNVTVDCIHHSGFSYRRHCSYYNVPNIMLMHDSQNLNQGMHQYNYKNQLDYTFGISAMATSAQRRALYAFFNIHPDKQREPAYNDSQYVQYHQGQQQQQQQFNAQPPQQINLQAQQQPQQQQQFAGQVQGDQPVTQPSAQPEPQPGQTPELTLENPMFADISNVIASFQNTSLAKMGVGCG